MIYIIYMNLDLSQWTSLSTTVEGDLALSVAVFLLTIIVFRVFKYFILHKLHNLAKKTGSDIDDLLVQMVKEVRWPFYLLLALYLSLCFLNFKYSVFALQALEYALLVIAAYYVIKAVQMSIDYGTRKVVLMKDKEEKEDISLINNMASILKTLVWGVVVIIILDNLGYDINALIAGLGIGGIAIALAIQNIAEDLFSSLSIHFDKPFVTGDFIIIGSDLGTVKKVGIKSTRIQTLHGEELVISNRELTSSRIHNYKSMEKRRVVFGFGVTYETPTEKLKRIPSIVQEVLASIDDVKLDRVHFKEFADFSLNFEVVYYVLSGGYNLYMDCQQAINLEIKERLEGEGVEMAYPTQTIYLNR
ncbi:MAG: mechanosensitive ion channel family protein [Candidatus Altiarchaeota archaeon]|nr:mechanosensitive ion channel family protein [Candidatus Altiarchaeota archaeon]